MTKNDRQKLSILIVLLGVLGLTIGLGFRNQPPATAAPPPTEQKTSSNPPAPNDARIRVDLLEADKSPAGTVRKNVFQYYQPPPPPPPPRPDPPATPTQPVQMTPPVQPRPAQPPSISLKYHGFAVTNPEDSMTAFLADDSRHYNVTVGEVLMGRYRILSITDKSVDVEDLELNRRQTLPLLK
jgi:hypothetical protein